MRSKLFTVLSAGLLLFTLVIADFPQSASASVVSRGPATAKSYASNSTKTLALAVPSGTQAGDVMIASLGFGRTGASAQPTLTAPSGWTLVRRTNKGRVGALAVYRHVYTAGETSYTWNTNVAVGGSIFLAAFGGVDPASPVDVSAGKTTTTSGTSFATPSVTTTAANDTLVASYAGYNSTSGGTAWTAPTGMTEVGDSTNGTNRSGTLDITTQTAAGSTGAKTAKASRTQKYAVAILTALRPDTSSTTPPMVSDVAASALTATGANISWTTDQAADSQVEYGPTTAYGSTTVLDPALVTSHLQSISGLTASTVYHYRVDSKNAAGLLTTSPDYTFQTAATPPAGATPVIVDTDLYSDADDVGALATAFGLEIKGEDNVIAINVNHPTDRSAVATSSWQCVAAIAQFYGHGDIPIGTDMPNNGTTDSSLDFSPACAAKATAPFPVPDTALNVYRRALAPQPDNSVAIVSIGFMENLSALLNSPADSISPLTGRDLVAQKVKSLTVMGGGYPSRSGETNLEGNVAAAQNVADNWPTKIVWDGYEVGDAVHTGSQLSSTHPMTSPVRAAYEAFVGANNWLESYDLTAVYHAVRPSDTLLTESGPGVNVIDSSGGNTFQASATGNQYYLKLTDATQLGTAIDSLIDTLPAAAPDTMPPVISNVAANSVGATTATIAWSTNEAADSRVSYGTSAAYGSTTALDSGLTTAHSESISGLLPSTTYHYAVSSRDAAGNISTSADATFTTSAAAPPVSGPNDNFDTNAIDSAKWLVSLDGSTVQAANGQLQIAHTGSDWTKGTVASATSYDQTGKSVQLQVVRAANNGSGGSTYGETSVFLQSDATHSVEFFIAGNSLTAWTHINGTDTNLNPSWPAYNATDMQWLRFRESGGTLYWEYAAGATAPGTWTVLASAPDPFPMTSVTFSIVAGSNIVSNDVATFDNVSTY